MLLDILNDYHRWNLELEKSGSGKHEAAAKLREFYDRINKLYEIPDLHYLLVRVRDAGVTDQFDNMTEEEKDWTHSEMVIKEVEKKIREYGQAETSQR